MKFSLKRLAVSLMLVGSLSAPGLFAQSETRRPPNPNPGPLKVPSGPVVIKILAEESKISAEIRNAPLQRVLEQLAARTGIVFEVQTQDNQPVDLSLKKVAIPEAIRRIAGERNIILYYAETNETPHEGTGEQELPVKYVRIFPGKDNLAQPVIRYIGMGEITQSSDDFIETEEQALKVLTTSTNINSKQKAIDVLVSLKNEMTLKVLLILVRDPAPEIRVAAIEGLTSIETRNALPQILYALKDPNPSVRQSAIMAIALLGNATHLKQLRPLGRDPDASVAAAAGMAIRKLSSGQ